jgi:MFS family permease
MSIFPYLQIISDLVQKRNGLNSDTAGSMFGIPYLISAIASPILGWAIDQLGRRALFITISSLLLIAAFIISSILPDTPGSKMEIIPLVIIGIGYSVYCAAIWSSIPYVVSPHTVGSAYGICTAIQNIGLVIAPTVVGYIKQNTTKGYSYFWVLMFFIAVNVVGFLCNAYLYYIDIKYYNGILNKVDKGEKITDLMTSPVETRRELIKKSMAKDLNR